MTSKVPQNIPPPTSQSVPVTLPNKTSSVPVKNPIQLYSKEFLLLLWSWRNFIMWINSYVSNTS